MDLESVMTNHNYDRGIAKNYPDIGLTFIAAKIYNALLRNGIDPEIEKILWKNEDGFQMAVEF